MTGTVRTALQTTPCTRHKTTARDDRSHISPGDTRHTSPSTTKRNVLTLSTSRKKQATPRPSPKKAHRPNLARQGAQNMLKNELPRPQLADQGTQANQPLQKHPFLLTLRILATSSFLLCMSRQRLRASSNSGSRTPIADAP